MLVYPLLFAEPHQQYFSQPNVQGPVYWNFELLSVCVCFRDAGIGESQL